jgi:hypothetical protein
MKRFRSTAVLAAAVCFLVGYNFMSAQWTPASGTPPANNTAAPINVGATTQAKSGNLMANIVSAATSTWSPRYCDALGNNCWEPGTGAPGGGGDDTIVVGGQCFEPAWAVTCNWNWSGSGNDNSTYIVPLYLNPETQGCLNVNRSYQYHTMILAECTNSGPITYSWVVSGWTACYAQQTCTTSGSQSRTVVCQDSNGYNAPDSRCTGPKPTTSQSCVAPRRGSDC